MGPEWIIMIPIGFFILLWSLMSDSGAGDLPSQLPRRLETKPLRVVEHMADRVEGLMRDHLERSLSMETRPLIPSQYDHLWRFHHSATTAPPKLGVLGMGTHDGLLLRVLMGMRVVHVMEIDVLMSLRFDLRASHIHSPGARESCFGEESASWRSRRVWSSRRSSPNSNGPFERFDPIDSSPTPSSTWTAGG